MVTYPANNMFNIGVNILPNFMKRKTEFNNWSDKSEEKNNSYKPKQFTKGTKWMDWKDHFTNSPIINPGRNGVPLNYVISDNVQHLISNNFQFLDD